MTTYLRLLDTDNVLARCTEQLAHYDSDARIYDVVSSVLRAHNDKPRQVNARLKTKIEDALKAHDIDVAWVYWVNSSTGHTAYADVKINIRERKDHFTFNLYHDGQKIDVDRSLRGHSSNAVFAKALRDKMPHVPAHVLSWNEKLRELAALSRDACPVAQIATSSGSASFPVYPLSGVFAHYELSEVK